jgi:tetratricopeptide (TPR) repeat protein
MMKKGIELGVGGILICALLLTYGCGNDEPGNISEEDTSASILESDSVSFYEQGILDNHNSPTPYWDRAGWHLRNGRITEGLNDLDLSIGADSTYGPAWSAKADALYLLQKFDPCIKHLDICLDYAPDYIPCKLRRAEMYIHLKQYELAFGLLNDALRLDKQLHEAYWMKGTIYREVGDMEKALSSFQTAVEVNPEFFDGYITLGIAHASQNNPLAVDYYNSAIRIRPRSVEARYNLAIYHQENGNLEDALALYGDILDIDTLNASAAFNSGYIHLEYQQDYVNAELWFTEAITRLPYYHQAFFNRGLARESQNNLEGALSDYNETLKLKPDYTPAAIAKSRVLKTEY